MIASYHLSVHNVPGRPLMIASRLVAMRAMR
jgi:hypothetical protein